MSKIIFLLSPFLLFTLSTQAKEATAPLNLEINSNPVPSNPVIPSQHASLPQLPDPSLLDNSEKEQRLALEGEVKRLLVTQDFAGLEALAKKRRDMPSPFASQFTPIDFFFGSVRPRLRNLSNEQLVAAEVPYQHWMDLYPHSAVARIVYAQILIDEAWRARGVGNADTVTEEGWKVFKEKLQESRDVLEKIKTQNNDAEWYGVMEWVAIGQGWDAPNFLTMVKEGQTRFPQEIALQNGALVYLLPQWYGSDAILLDYATKAADQAGGDAGDIIYAQMAMGIWNYEYNINVFTETHFSWPRVAHGMELLCQKYPHSKQMLNYFALFSWQAQDRAVAQRVFKNLGTHHVSSVWRQQDYWIAQAWAK